jgi:hypothetical protein
LLVFRTSVRDQLAYVINNYYVPVDRSWSFVLDGYPSQVGSTAERNLSYPLDFPLPIAIPIYVGMAGLVVLLVLFLVRAPREPYFDLHRGAVLGYALFLAAAANPQGYRLELIALPTLAVVLAFWARIARRWLALQREGRRPRALDVPSCTWVSCGC